ncbi:PREDICTED: neo-calmodulin [Drosophila arizonae]|uniref:Neo-calmodulin n=1 Tax=Drosophila arizonae TaxID=7263 RepID=A0ABM1PKY0_DROAR|nr:PREDICTED: neo-calmodulin [Drosophila arizonae]
MEAPAFALNEDQMNEVRDAFGAFDPNNTGKIKGKEMGLAMRTLGYCPTEAELYDLIDEIDMDGDGEIEFMEFVMMITKRMEGLTKIENLRVIFKLFDRDDDGFIAANEMRNVMHNLGERCSEEEFNEMMKEVDADNDGKLSFQDFVNAVRN